MARADKILWALVLVLAGAGPAQADKLVVFQNGRTLRVSEVRDEGQWLFLTLGKKSEMGVLSRLIASVAEIEGDTPAQVPNVQSAAGGSSPNRGGTVSNRTPAVRQGQPPMAQEGGDAAEQQEEADEARTNALSRAAARAARNSKIGLVPGNGTPQEQDEGKPGTDLTGPASSGGWRSLLDQSRGGASGRQREDDSQQDDEDPER